MKTNRGDKIRPILTNNSPSFETLERFARALKVRVAELFNF
ncbi:MAG TPA: hypothetical protein VFC29_03240 [Candidatus Limnocylindrales bacterium]|nr:hypothetical protein [Candidatus Limnocylindrales bacterium]